MFGLAGSIVTCFVMDIDSEDDIFDEEVQIGHDDWGMIWDAGIEEDGFDGDLYDNGDVDDSSIDESEDMSAEVLEGHMIQIVATCDN